jgi:SagB-type dehydrogenase family enzyme
MRPRFLARQSFRRFQESPLELGAVAAMLESLYQMDLDEAPLPKSLYPSAGGLYPVQAYLYVKSRRIEGLEGGVYYYHPQRHELVLLTPDVEIAADVHTPNNFYIHDGAAFGLFLIGKLSAIEPLYGEAARDFCLLEAGYIGQLLQTVGFTHNIGLCPVGGVDFDRIRTHFDLDADHIYLHSLMVGGISDAQKTVFATVEEAANAQKAGSSDNGSLEDRLRQHLAQHVPTYMVPATFVVLDQLPLSRNGKVERSALPVPARVGRESEPKTITTAQADSVTNAIAEVVSEFVAIGDEDLNTPFFDLGLTSLQIIQLSVRLQKAVDQSLTVMTLFEHSSVAALADRIRQSAPKDDRNTSQDGASSDSSESSGSQGERRGLRRRAERRRRDKRS